MRKDNAQPNLLEGPLLGKIFRFAVPVLLMQLLQTLYSAADMIVVGLSGVDGAIGAIGTTAAMTAFFVNLIAGFSVGANVLVARYIGARDEKKTGVALHTAVCVSALFGLISMLLGLLTARPLLILIGDQGSVLELARKYADIYYIALPFLSLTNCFMAVFRAKGDTRTPLYVMSAAGLLNVILNLVFVLLLHRSVDGVAWATVISNIFSAGLLAFLLSKDTGWCRFSLKALTISKRSLRDLTVIGLPASIQGCLFCISNMMISSSVVGLNNLYYPGGSAIIDGNAAAGNIECFVASANVAVSQATVTFVSQHFGAGLFPRIKKVRRSSFAAGMILTLCLSGLVILFRRPLLSLYVSEEAAIQAGLTRIMVMITVYFLGCFMDLTCAFLRGMGKSVLATAVTVFCVIGFRFFWLLVVFPKVNTLACIYLCWPLSWTITGIAQLILGTRELKRYLK